MDDEKRRLALVEDEFIELQASLAEAGCPPSYFASIGELQHQASVMGYDKLTLLPCFIVDAHGVKRAVCIRCKVAREDLDGHLRVMLYTPPKDKEYAYLTFVCPGCSHEKYLEEVMDLCVYAREELASLE